MTAVDQLLLEEGYHSVAELERDWSLLVALSRVEQYQAECEFFERTYGLTLTEFEQQLHKTTGREDFEQEEHLADWEFAAQALSWWQAQVEELEHAANGD